MRVPGAQEQKRRAGKTPRPPETASDIVRNIRDLVKQHIIQPLHGILPALVTRSLKPPERWKTWVSFFGKTYVPDPCLLSSTP